MNSNMDSLPVARYESAAPEGISSSHIRNMWLTILVLLGIGLLLTLLNIHWPVARNALDYMKATLDIIARHFDLAAVARDYSRTGGKPILFSLVATPLVWLFNANAGIVLASTFGTALFLITSAFALRRLGNLSDLGRRILPLELILTVLNPLLIYQFWSGYPDTLFAAMVILAFVLTDIISREPERDTRWHLIALGLTLCAAVHTKLYGAILALSCPLYLVMYGKSLIARSTHLKSKIAILCLIWVALAVVFITAKLDVNPLIVLSKTTGFSSYIASLKESAIRYTSDSTITLGFTILLAFQFALLFLLSRAAWRSWTAAPTMFVTLYVIGLLPFSGTSINMRYFLPIFPFVAHALATGIQSFSLPFRRSVLSTYAVVALILVSIFNIPVVEEIASPYLKRLYSQHPKIADLADNLRLPVQIAIRQQMDAVNAIVPAGSTLYWSSDYYGTATHGLAHYLGVKNGLNMRYVLQPSDPEPSDRPVFLTEFVADVPPNQLWRAPTWATPTSVGYGLFRLDPLSVSLISTSGDYVSHNGTIHLSAIPITGNNFNLRSVEFIEGNNILSTYDSPPFELAIPGAKPGRHEFHVRVHYVEHEPVVSVPITIYVAIPALERTARDTEDIIMEFDDATIHATKDELLLDSNEREIGIRFSNITIPRGSRVTHAYLTLQAASVDSGKTTLDVHAELASNAKGLSYDDGDLSHRIPTTAHATWTLGPWSQTGQRDQSPDLAPLLEEVLSLPSWQGGNSLMFLIRVSGHERSAQSVDINDRHAPILNVILSDM